MIVHSCTSESFSGLERYMVDLATAQKERGEVVEVFCRQGSEIQKECEARGVTTWLIGADDKPGPALWWALRDQWRERLAAPEGVVLHMHHHGELWFHRPWLGKPRKTILQFHLWITHKKKNPFHSWLYKKIDEVWCSSEPAQRMLSAILPVASHRFRVVPYGRDVAGLLAAPRSQYRKELHEKLHIPENAVVAATVARMEPIKGIGELVEAFSRLAPRLPRAHLILAGGPSPQNEESRRFNDEIIIWVESLPPDVRARLHLTGFLPAERVLAAADFYVLPSYEECMSLVLQDALVMGLPALGTAAGGTPALVRPDVTGLLVPPRDAIALEKAMERLFTDEGARARWGEEAAKLAVVVDEKRVVDQILSWYVDRR